MIPLKELKKGDIFAAIEGIAQVVHYKVELIGDEYDSIIVSKYRKDWDVKVWGKKKLVALSKGLIFTDPLSLAENVLKTRGDVILALSEKLKRANKESKEIREKIKQLKELEEKHVQQD